MPTIGSSTTSQVYRLQQQQPPQQQSQSSKTSSNSTSSDYATRVTLSAQAQTGIIPSENESFIQKEIEAAKNAELRGSPYSQTGEANKNDYLTKRASDAYAAQLRLQASGESASFINVAATRA